MNRHQTAQYYLDKINAAKAPLALFVVNGAIKTTKVTTNLFHEALSKTPQRLMGVYDGECLLKWLEEDLEYMGIA